jgi:hypothetical protein
MIVGLLTEEVATLDVEDDLLEADATIRLEPQVLGVIPGEVLHHPQLAQRVPDRHTLAAPVVPETAPEPDLRGQHGTPSGGAPCHSIGGG